MGAPACGRSSRHKPQGIGPICERSRRAWVTSQSTRLEIPGVLRMALVTSRSRILKDRGWRTRLLCSHTSRGDRPMDRLFVGLGAFAAFIAVALGAFAAHALKSRLTADALALFEIGVRYQLYHALGLLAVAVARAH